MIKQLKMYDVVIKSYARCKTRFLMVWFFLLMHLIGNNKPDVAVSSEGMGTTILKDKLASLVIV